MADLLDGERETVRALVGDQAGVWDRAGLLPLELLRKLGGLGLLSAQIPAAHGGRGADSRTNGEFTAYVGSLCSSLRSVMTSQGMAAWTIERLGTREQHRAFLPGLSSGQLAAVGFSETDAGSDLSAIGTRIRRDGDSVVVDGAKRWITASHYADLLVIVGQYDDGAAAVVIPADTPGVHVERVAEPMGCRAAGHADLRFDSVRVPAENVLGGTGLPLPLVVTAALGYGRMSVAWGCVGILRACLGAAATHAKGRQQFGKPIAEHQLVARHIAELYVSEQIASRACEHASGRWDAKSPDMVVAAVTAKHIGAGHAARGAAAAVQVLASAGAQDGHVVARAYRDAKLMEVIEGSNEICQLILSQHALSHAE
ncbi:acyl-CoA dehydrogenase family protein [Streptomyces sp. NBC_01411]|uniref:acyl-CoA dehydrogenase family protein n=1 Tax=Streptomyces sp. NBC_01411 TaxID=2903857 RepID=UPI00386F19AC